MLETTLVDEDYFTPNTSTTLANIFSKTNEKVQDNDNPSLKYVPPKMQSSKTKPDEPKTTQCIFACALFGYAWHNNKYTSKGKLGLAIVKFLSPLEHNIVIYDSNKTTLSCTLITPALEINVEGDVYVSFYDGLSKYWSLHGRQDEISKLVEALKNINATVKFAQYNSKGPPIPDHTGNPKNNETFDHLDIEERRTFDNSRTNETFDHLDMEEKGSDTDSINKKTKASLLSRIANVGHAILPPNTEPIEKTSDSSDNNIENCNVEPNKPFSQLRYKAMKNLGKRTKYQDKYHPTSQVPSHSLVKITVPDEVAKSNMPLYTWINGQLMPLNNNISNASSNSGADISFLMTEQRICNSELRINMSKISEKVDDILHKVKDNNINEDKSKTDFQMGIAQKLISEYERKIKMYEDYLSSNGVDVKTITTFAMNTHEQNTKHDESIDFYQDNIRTLEQTIKDKDSEIEKLKDDTKNLKKELNTEKEFCHREIAEMKKAFDLKAEELDTIKKECEGKFSNSHKNEPDTENKIKSIMNDTFRAISANFESSESCSGETVKNITAAVIKQVTLESLKPSEIIIL